MIHSFVDTPQTLGVNEAIVAQNVDFGRYEESIFRRIGLQIIVLNQQRRHFVTQ